MTLPGGALKTSEDVDRYVAQILHSSGENRKAQVRRRIITGVTTDSIVLDGDCAALPPGGFEHGRKVPQRVPFRTRPFRPSAPQSIVLE